MAMAMLSATPTIHPISNPVYIFLDVRVIPILVGRSNTGPTKETKPIDTKIPSSAIE